MDLLNYFRNNKKEMYKLIEIRNNDFKDYENDSKLEFIRNKLIEEQINKILDLCKNKEVFYYN